MMVRDSATVRFSNVVFCGGRGMCGTEFSTNTIRVQQCTAAFQFDTRFRLIIEYPFAILLSFREQLYFSFIFLNWVQPIPIPPSF